MRSFNFRLAAFSIVLFASAHAHAQCGALDPRFHAPGIEPPGFAAAAAVYDSGSGPELYFGGSFARVGGTAVSNIVRWDGTQWLDVGGGTNGTVRALLVYDDGNGPKLYAAGAFTIAGGNHALRIARWDGSSWTSLGNGLGVDPANEEVDVLCIYDSGSGPELYAGGVFTFAGGVGALDIARWNFAAQAWIPMPGIPAGTSVEGLAVFDDGTGTKLYVGGNGLLRRWNGTQWSTFTTSPPGYVRTLGVFDDGTGPALYIGGKLAIFAGPEDALLSWNGAGWTLIIVDTGNAYTKTLTMHDDGSGPALYIGGSFAGPGGLVGRVKKWDGTAITDVTMLAGAAGSAGSVPQCFAVFDEGAGNSLFVGGPFGLVGSVAGGPSEEWIATAGIARWRAGAWTSVGPGLGLPNACWELFAADLGTGTKLFAGGQFASAGPAGTYAIASWDGSQWSGLGQGIITASVSCFASYDDGSGPSLAVGGAISSAGGQPVSFIARWNGSAWSSFGPGLSLPPISLLEFDDGSGPALFAGGFFPASPNLPATYVAKWNGSSWSAIAPTPFGYVMHFVAFDDGGGERLFAAGQYYVSANQAAVLQRWDGSSWTQFGVANNSAQVVAAVVADLGGGPRLYLGGSFVNMEGSGANNIVSWDGTTWSPLGAGVDGQVTEIILHDDGTGPALYVGGSFTLAGGLAIPSLARWDGTGWSAPSFTTPVTLKAMASYDDGSGGGADLYLGGLFATMGGVTSNNIAELVRCAEDITTFCYGDGGAKVCPCGNHSPVAGRGCDNSAATGGALLTGSGTTSPDTVVLASSGELPSVLTIFLQGSASAWPGINFGDGLRCVGGTLKRLYTHSAVGGFVVAPVGSDPPITVRSAQLGDTIQPGDIRYYQAWYRDPNASFCPIPTGSNWNVSSGIVVRW